MNLRDMMVPFMLAIATTWAVQYFFLGKKDANEQYQFSAPQSAVECKPLQKEVTFAPAHKGTIPLITLVSTNWGMMEFTTEGAALNRLEFKRKADDALNVIGTIFPPDRAESMERALLVALPTQTPLMYTLVATHDEGEKISLRYEGSDHQATLYKTFTVYKERHQIDLTIEVHPKGGAGVNVRVFYPAPIIPELKEQQQTAADLIYGANSFKKIYRDAIAPETYWIKPTLFGVENKYFVHGLIADTNDFVQRAYFKMAEKEGLIAIIEGPYVEVPTAWTLSFYVGPKEAEAMKVVDGRLEQLLDYSGMWAPLSRILLTLLHWLNNYLHNYGLAIILLTLLIKLLLLPFAWRAERGMKDRAEMQKRLQYIQQKYKDDPQGRAQAQAEFMRKNGLGLAGCLPLLMQVPIFFGLSRVLSSAIELYKVPFLWIPDLSGRDPYFVLPVLVMGGMLGSALNVPDTKQRLPIIAMAFAFGAVTASMASGLVLYIALSTLLNLVQNRLFKFFQWV
jgi:YidC/Oxa1 family membrane protein insertase